MSDVIPYDVAVIGSGVFGAWTAYSLRQSGATVALIDAYGPANSRASSGGESRIIRMGYGADEIYTRWSLLALPLWQQLFAQAGKPELFQRTGVLWIAHENDRYALDTLATLQKLQIRFDKLSLADLRDRYPQISFDDDAWGILEPDSGVLMARRAVAELVAQAKKAGVDFRAGQVIAPEGRGRITSLKTSSGEEILAGTFVFACGPWLPKLFPDVLADRMFISRQEIFFFGVPAGSLEFAQPALPTWLYLRDEFYGMPDLESRGFKVADDRHGPIVDPDTQPRMSSVQAIAAARNFVGKRFPALKNAPIIESRVCQYENTSNGDFLIDRHPEFENVWLVGGGSGHSFKHGPSLGEYVAELVLQGGTPEAPKIEPRFSLATKQSVQNRAIH
jgi:monomeric sarcosine oxidase